MADKTISDLEQISELVDSLKIPCEGDTGNTSNLSLSQLLAFLHAPVGILNISGASPSYTANPSTTNVVYTMDLSGINASDSVQINLPAGSSTRESQIIIKIKNPNKATVTVAGLQYKLSMYNLVVPNVQLVLDYDQSLKAWVGGTLPVESI